MPKGPDPDAAAIAARMLQIRHKVRRPDSCSLWPLSHDDLLR